MRERLEGEVFGGGDSSAEMYRSLLADCVTKWLAWGWPLDGAGFGDCSDEQYQNARALLRDFYARNGISPKLGEEFKGTLSKDFMDDLNAADLRWDAFYKAVLKHCSTGIVNLTQHTATAEQADAGVVEPENKAAVQAALTFDAIPSANEMRQRADFLAAIAKDSGRTKAMIGGAPFFMATLERALLNAGIMPIYAFSVRDSREESDGNGGVRKVNVFKHVGFVEAAQ